MHRITTDDPAAIASDLVALHSSDPATVHLACLVWTNAPSIAAAAAEPWIGEPIAGLETRAGLRRWSSGTSGASAPPPKPI